MSAPPFASEISRRIWWDKYRLASTVRGAEHTVEDTWRRIAGALASAETERASWWEERFYDALAGFKFLPGGRIQAGAGSGREVTLFNCFVMGPIEDSLDGIFRALREGALTMQQGGGIGYDFSSLRPAGTRAKRTGSIASGPLSFMRIWDSMCATINSGGNRRGAMMATLRCDHPDILAFVDAKRDGRELRNFNLSVLVTDALLDAVGADAEWPLVFPVSGMHDGGPADETVIVRRWSGDRAPEPCRVIARLRARDLWNRIAHAAYDCAEPGVIFIDRVNRENNLAYRERISATNPCGEVPLPPYGACDLGALNLTGFVREPFTPRARLDVASLRQLTAVAVRMLDNVIDVSHFPLPQQAQAARGTRRIGLGITGLADALIMLGMHYAQEQARRQAAQIARTICHAAYRASVRIARQKGTFPYFDEEAYLDAPFVRRLPPDIQSSIRRGGIRNSHLLSIAPTGTISLLANNVSSGIEPVFAFRQLRTLRTEETGLICVELEDYAHRLWRELCGDLGGMPSSFIDATALAPADHLAMQAALQPHVDSAISKTINIGTDVPFEDVRSVFRQAFDLGLKGCTIYRPNPVRGAVLTKDEASQDAGAHCCTLERESD